MATANCAEPLMPKLLRVLNGFEMVSMMEMVWLVLFTVMMPPGCGLMASEVGLMAIAIGDVSMEIVFALRLVGAVPDMGKSRDRSISETVLLPVFATRAAPVPSLMATPVGVVPTVTAGTFWVRVTRSRTEAVPLVLLATTANPKRGLTAIPCGAVPVSIGFPIG